jgi:dynein heavy chain
MLSAGCDAKMTTFVLTDTQIMYESFLEDVNNLLNTGEITNLYLKEDYDRMIDT